MPICNTPFFVIFKIMPMFLKIRKCAVLYYLHFSQKFGKFKFQNMHKNLFPPQLFITRRVFFRNMILNACFLTPTSTLVIFWQKGHESGVFMTRFWQNYDFFYQKHTWKSFFCVKMSIKFTMLFLSHCFLI